MTSNVPKKKSQRKLNLPKGPARYDPSSPEWKIFLLEQLDKNKSKTSSKTKRSVARIRKVIRRNSLIKVKFDIDVM